MFSFTSAFSAVFPSEFPWLSSHALQNVNQAQKIWVWYLRLKLAVVTECLMPVLFYCNLFGSITFY